MAREIMGASCGAQGRYSRRSEAPFGSREKRLALKTAGPIGDVIGGESVAHVVDRGEVIASTSIRCVYKGQGSVAELAQSNLQKVFKFVV